MALRVLKDIKRIYAGLNPEAIRETASRPAAAGLLARSEEEFQQMEEFLAPSSLDPALRNNALRAVHRSMSDPEACDFVLCSPGTPIPSNGFLFDPHNFDHRDRASLARAIVSANQANEVALARTFPALRKAAIDRIITRTARENAMFSLVTALPNMVPSVIELPWTVGEFATDTAFLTMNQVRMALTLAAAHDRPIGFAEQKMEIAAIAAGAFGWRAIARELVGKIPLGGGLIPKAAISFAGTYVVGLGLDKFHRTGSGLTREERRDAYATAFEKGKEAARELAPQASVQSD